MTVRRGTLRSVLGAVLLISGGCAAVAGAWIPIKAQVAQVLLEVAWKRTMVVAPARPWPWADTVPVARLSLPRLREEQIVLAGASGRTMAFGPARVDGTGVPGRGNCVITGHRDTTFRQLGKLRRGDVVLVQDRQGKTWRYRVTAMRVIHARDTSVLENTGGARLTLITCYPFGEVTSRARLRFAVHAELDSAIPIKA